MSELSTNGSPLPVIKVPTPTLCVFKIENGKNEQKEKIRTQLQVPQKQANNMFFNFSQLTQSASTAIQQGQNNL
jgi:hypothetical protein